MSNEGMNGEVGVTVLTLSDCDYCKWLKSELDGHEIPYIDIDADKFSNFADDIERKFKTNTYPIVFLNLGNKVVTIVPETELAISETLRTFDTIPELIGIIKSYIK